MKKIYSISHIDMDGFGCQFMIDQIFADNYDISYFNVNYGKPINNAFTEISKVITKEDILFISDVNLTIEQADQINILKEEIGFELFLYDHHENGKACSEKYDWYHLDKASCATKIVYEKLTEQYNVDTLKKYILERISEIVNVYDLWLDSNEIFVHSKALNQMIHDADKMFPRSLQDIKRKYIFSLFISSGLPLSCCQPLVNIEQEKYINDRKFFDDPELKNEPLHILRIKFMYNSIVEKGFTYFSVDGFKGVVFTGLSEIFQEFSHILLHKNEDIDLCINISSQGHFGTRSIKDNINLAELSAKYWYGGGHPKAAGGCIFPKDLAEKDKPRIREYELIDYFLENCSVEKI